MNALIHLGLRKHLLSVKNTTTLLVFSLMLTFQVSSFLTELNDLLQKFKFK